MNPVIVCPVCGHFNPQESTRCVECWASLDRTDPVGLSQAQELAIRREAALKRRRLLRIGLAGLVALIVAAAVFYANVRPFSSLPPPMSAIEAEFGVGEWPMFRRNPAHTAFDSSGAVLSQGVVVWSYTGDSPMASAPAVVDGRVYLSTGDRSVVALDASTGEHVWGHRVTGPIDSSVAVAGEMAFVGLRDATLLALDRETGQVRWEFRTSGPIPRSPAVKQGELYIGSDDFGVYALDAMSGEERWVYQTGGRISSSAAVNDDVVAITSEDKYLYVLDRSSGRPRMDFRLTTGSRSPVLSGPLALVIDGRGRLTAVDSRWNDRPFDKFTDWAGVQAFAWNLVDDVPAQGGFVWSYIPTGDGLVGEPAVAEGRVYTSAASGVLHALDLSTGEPIWEFRARTRFQTSPSVQHRTVFVGDVDGTLYAVDVQAGQLRWELDTGSEILSSPVVAGGTVYVSTADGGLLAIR